MKKRTFLKWLVWVPITVTLFFGCSGKGKDLRKIEGDPAIFYREGLARFNKKDYIDAQKKFEELKSSFPDSPPYTVWAELKVGDCHFLKKEYVEAIAAYEEFKKIHPSHEEIPYVQFQIGMSYFNLMLTLDRDQTSTKKALSSFEYLIATYPPSLFTEKAREKVGVCKKRLADHEFYIGNFYYKHERFDAAAWRFEGLLQKFPKVPEEDKTLYFLGKSYLKLGLWEKAELTFMKIVTEYPKSPHFKEARAILDKGFTENEVSLRKAKARESAKKDEGVAIDPDKIVLIKFEEEEKRPVSLTEEKKVDLRGEGERSTSLAVMDEPVRASPPKKVKGKKSVSPPALQPVQEDRVHALPPSVETNKPEPVLEPMKEVRVQLPLPSPSADTASDIQVIPDDEKKVAVFPATPAPSEEKENVEKKAPTEINQPERAESVDKGQPIDDVTSDKEETKKSVSPPAIEPAQEDRSHAFRSSAEMNRSEPALLLEPMKEDRSQPPLPPLSADTASNIQVIPDEEKRVAAFPAAPEPSKERENVEKKALLGTNKARRAEPADKGQPIDVPSDKKAVQKASEEKNEAKLTDPVDKGQPIDVTSDKVEAYWKENLVIFKGNVIARQKDMVIYADSLEVVTHEDGKGIERAIAGGNVKIQQGLRVANCQKAVFYNLDKKLVLTGDPKVSEGDNIVLGDEIIFDMDKNRVEVKGGPSGRGKAKVLPGGIEKLK